MKPLALFLASLHLIVASCVFWLASVDPEKKAWTLSLALFDFPCALVLGFLCTWWEWLRHAMEASLLLQASYFVLSGSAWFYLIGYLLQLIPLGTWVKLLGTKIDGP